MNQNEYLNYIRNFSIIAHIDHGKSTLSDRMIEKTKTVEQRKMHSQVLDTMELEQERGITIKMQPVRMEYQKDGQDYIFNLIDTPGHIDFSYEVSRAMQAVEGAILLVDATQGIQAQTLTTLQMAKDEGLKIIPALSKIDSPLARVDEVKEEIAILLDVEMDEIIETSGKTGDGVEKLFEKIIKEIPAPKVQHQSPKDLRALVFDFAYHPNKGIIVYVRILDGEVKKTDDLYFKIVKHKFKSNEVGVFKPQEVETEKLKAGEIGYIVTGIKEPGIASVGDTVVFEKNQLQEASGYDTPKPVVWASLYPEDQDDFEFLKTALSKLRLSDSSLTYEEEVSGSLGRGYRCGFLGMLHLEIVTERLKREYNLNLIITHPTIIYKVKLKSGEEKIIYNPAFFPDFGDIKEVTEPWVICDIITPSEYSGAISQLFYHHEGSVLSNINFGDGRVEIKAEIPLRELMRGFFDKLKSETSGYASLAYTSDGYRKADVARMDILVAEERIVAFSRVVSRPKIQQEAESAVEKLHKVMPRQNFVMKIQAKFEGRILSSKTVKAYRKDVTGKLYGGDITRKRKLLEKQKKGKKKMKDIGRVHIPHSVFLKMMKND
ncbi:elongation factor 4 [Candidatus Campbellbacteria bacterium]|nr:MAG: elongation factor 4 [Candidatus Campbellbacteria bacterium]